MAKLWKERQRKLSFPREFSLLDVKSDSICTVFLLLTWHWRLSPGPCVLGLSSAYEPHSYLSICISSLTSLLCCCLHVAPSCAAYDFRAVFLSNRNLTLAVLMSPHEKRRREVSGTLITGGNRCSTPNSREAHPLPRELVETDGLGQLSTRIMANR